MKKLIIILVVAAAGIGFWLSRMDAPIPNVQETQVPVGNDEIETAELSAVGEYTGVGVAARTWDDITFAHSINADLEAPAPGKFYEGWLVRPDPFEIISTGKLAPNAIGYGVSFTSDRDLRNFTNVVVTEETEIHGLDGVPEAHVLEGSF